MGRTMQTARKRTGMDPSARPRRTDDPGILSDAEDFAVPSCVRAAFPAQSSSASSSSSFQPAPPQLKTTNNHLAQDIQLPTIFGLTAQTLNIPIDRIQGRMRKVVEVEAMHEMHRDAGRSKKVSKLTAEADGIEILENVDPRYQKDNKTCRIFHEEQEMRLGTSIQFDDKEDGEGKWKSGYWEAGSDRGDPSTIKALTALVRHAVGDDNKLFLDQTFCLKRQSDTSGVTVDPKMIVLDNGYQDTPLFRYMEVPYTASQRRIMEYTSCIPGSGEQEGKHWRNALEALLSSRNQQDQPFSTRIKIYLVNRPAMTPGVLQPAKDFLGAFPHIPHDHRYGNISKGVWNSLRIGIVFEVYANPAKMYTTPSNIVTLNNRRIIMQAFCPGPIAVRALASEGAPETITLDDFYSKLSPAPVPTNSLDAYQPPGMTARLLPFQKRSVAWLMAREQASNAPYQSVGLWEKLPMGSGRDNVDIAYNRVTGEARPLKTFDALNKGKKNADRVSEDPRAIVFDDEVLLEDRDDLGLKDIRGGMLCEEMGLGKTLEAIALTMLSRDNGVKHESPLGTTTYDQDLELNVTKVQATLIVTPETLIQQWHQEIRQYAPGLKVVVYEGWRSVHDQFYGSGKSNGKRKRGVGDVDENPEKSTIEKWVDSVAKADIVLTTFRTVQTDWNVAPPPIKRARRSTAAYAETARPRSALLLCDWLRVVIDEIQELDIASASKAANMIKTIKRRFSLAISGTPAKVAIEDLASSLMFLGANMSTREWKRIATPAFVKTFHAIFKNIAVRHFKAALSPEDMTMSIPRQTRYLVPIRLNRVERAYYNETYETNVDALQRSHAGFTDIVKLRGVLHILRMICTHMQVGQLGTNATGGRAARIKLDNQIMTMMDALQRMEEDAESNFLSRLLELGRSRMRQAMLLVLETSQNWPRARAIYEDVYRESDRTLKDLEQRIGAAEEQDARSVTSADSEEPDGGKGDREAYITVLRTRKHDLYLMQHEAAFRLGDIFSSDSVQVERKAEQEEEWYATASKIRSGMLESSARAANSYRDKVRAAIARGKIKVFDELEVDFAESLGLLGSRVQEPLNARIDALNDNAEFLWNVRGKIVGRLLEAIGDNAEDGSTKDYEQTLEEQYELESHMWIYQLAMADRREFMIEERNALALHEDRAEAARAEREGSDMEEPAAPGMPASEAGPDIKEKLITERDAIRAAAQEGMSLKAAQMDLNDIGGRYGVRYEEAYICKSEADRLKKVIKRQTDICKRLADEFAAFNACFNRRVAYYRALQTISDTLVDVVVEGSVQSDLDKATERIIAAKASYDKVNARRRYLESIRNEDEETADGCPICQEHFGHRGAQEIVILDCLHRLCAPCYKALRVRYFRPICPTCRAEISSSDDVRKIALHKPPKNETDGLGKISAEEQSSAWLSAHIHPENFHIGPEHPEMLSIDIFGNWGSKVDRLIRQLRFWRTREPAVKHIIFSSWKDALTIVEAALRANRISFLSRNGKKNDRAVQRFNEDSTIQVFLLHGEKENSGLTLTAASVCHLLEPVINSGFEMQAIGRVDRLGQKRETTVYCYAAEETVEAKIVNRAKDNRTSLYAINQNEGVSERATAASSVARKGGDDLSGNRDDILDLLLH